MDKYMKCKKCGYTLFSKLDNISFECEKCKHINNFMTKIKNK